MAKKVTLFACPVCGKLTTGRIPRAQGRRKGDRTWRYPRRHKDKSGQPCKGNLEEAIWVDVKVKGKPTNEKI